MQNGRGDGRELERITITTRDEQRAVSAFLFGHGCGEKVVGLVAWRLRIREAGGADQAGQHLQLIDQLLIELTCALIGRKQSLSECRHAEGIPADQHSAWLFAVVQAQQEIGEANHCATAAVAGPPDRFRQCVVGAVRERVTVDDEERSVHRPRAVRADNHLEYHLTHQMRCPPSHILRCRSPLSLSPKTAPMLPPRREQVQL
jgi:hypothetical protein